MKIVFIGAGNVATQLGKALQNTGNDIIQVFSRTMKSAVELASILNASFTTELSKISPDADIYIVAVSDRAIESVVQNFPHKDKLIIHTAGSVDISVFQGYVKQYGVLYPLQTFSKFKDLNFNEIPIFIESNSDSNTQILINFAQQLSTQTIVTSSKQRMMLHLSAVFANNFANHMCAIAEDILKENNFNFSILKPLLKETYEKMNNFTPFESQTGPAVRNDTIIINKHIELLSSFPKFVATYKIISDSIKELHVKEN